MQLTERGDGAATPIPFYDQTAEQSVIGSALLLPKLMPELSQALKPDDFYSPAHQKIWKAVLKLDAAGDTPDPIMLCDLLARDGALEAVGGRSFVHTLTSGIGVAGNAPRYAEVVKRHSLNRRLQRLLDDVHRAQGHDDPIQILGGLQDALAHLEQEGTSDVLSLDSLLHEHWERLDAMSKTGNHLAGLSTGFPPLDKITSGLMPANLIILASRPAMGKTAFALSILKTVTQARHPALMFSLEMAQLELTSRLISAHAQLPGQLLLNAQLNPDQWDLALKAHSELASLPLYIDDTPGISFVELRAKARRLHRRTKLSLLVVDYLQLMSSHKDRDNREQEVADISKSLKGLAKELDIPVIALAQLNRGPEARPDKRPLLSDLRESGGIEQDADIVLMLYRPDYYDPNEAPGEVEVINRKNRHGPTGTVALAFQRDCGRFAVMGSYNLEGRAPSHYQD